MKHFEDAFNLLCGKLIGEGIHRKVFECRLDKSLVVKVEQDNQVWRDFANVKEMAFWCDHQYHAPTAKWLAPCEYLSPDGYILLQKRVRPIADGDKLPATIPGFLTDIKRENFGWLGGRLVCIDYASTIGSPSLRLRKAHWA